MATKGNKPSRVRSYSVSEEAERVINIYATEHGMSRSAAVSALVLYGTAWVQERAKKRAT